MKKIIKKLLNPNKILGFFLFNISFILLIYVFARHLENSPIAYIAYLLSTYALILFIIWFWKTCKFSTEFIKTTKIYQLYEKNWGTVLKSTLFISTVLNIGYCLFNLIVGIYYKSFWFITFAVYYFCLIFMRLSLLYSTKHIGKNLKKEYQKLKRCGIVLLLLNIVLIGIIIIILRDNQAIHYSGFVIYVVAMYDFYLIISAFINIIKYRNSKSPILLGSKAIKVTVALISLISLEVAMITEFGGNDSQFKSVMTGGVGFFVCLINSSMAIYLIIKSNKYLKNQID